MIFNRERVIVVGLVHKDQSREQADEFLDELELLADTAGGEVIERVVQERRKLDPAFLIGRGKAEELAQMAKYLDADLIIFDDDLTPAQTKNIENLCKVKIVDRSGLILDIFAKHAKTKEARTQVELAQLNYLLPRLTRQWTHLSRQVGGIGVRGPGETQLEVDRRLIRKRIRILEDQLEKIEKQRIVQRKKRNDVFKAALVGYTNVGKSTLLNSLTKSEVLAEDQLFATLDSTVRTLDINDKKSILLIDTVGFIRKLPHHLVASFKSTLEEVDEADLLLHVIDVSNPNFQDQIAAVEQVLADMGVHEKNTLKIFNKIDKLENSALINHLKETAQPCVLVSAERGFFLNDLEEKLDEYSAHFSKSMTIELYIHQTKLLSQLYEMANVNSVEYVDDKAIINLETTIINATRISRLVDQTKEVTH